MTWDSADVWQPLWGLAEIGETLGVRRQTVAMWLQRRQMPEPDIRLAMGPIWYGGEIAVALEGAEIEPWMALKIERQLFTGWPEASLNNEKWAMGAARDAQLLEHGPFAQAIAANMFRAAASGLSFEEWDAYVRENQRDLPATFDDITNDLYGQGFWPWEPFQARPSLRRVIKADVSKNP